jgi:uncharacterized protein (TIGR03000 family)
MRPTWKCLLVGAVVAVALTTAAPQADAHWWGWRCGYGCYSPYYVGGYWGGCGWGGCGWGGYGYYGRGYCGSCCYAAYYPTCSSCYSTCDSCGGGSVLAPSNAPSSSPTPAPTPAKKPIAEPAMPTEPGTPPAPAPAMPKTSSTAAEESGVLTVWVPDDATVTVNGLETRSSGSRRQFVSFGLKPGFSYKYVVRAQVVRNGQVQDDTRTVVLTAGQVTAVAFGFNTPTQQVASAR